jgi:lysophospholipase L1-like esterase
MGQLNEEGAVFTGLSRGVEREILRAGGGSVVARDDRERVPREQIRAASARNWAPLSQRLGSFLVAIVVLLCVELPAHAAKASITITTPARGVDAFPDVATIEVPRPSCGSLIIPYIQTDPLLLVAATATNVPAGGAIRFTLTDATNTIVRGVSVVSGPASVGFPDLPKGEYTLDAAVVSASGTVIDSDRATHIAIGDIYVAIGDSVTAGQAGLNYTGAFPDWTTAPVASLDNRNYPQCGIPYAGVSWVSHHVALNDRLSVSSPVFILNEGVGFATSATYLNHMQTPDWLAPMAALHPNKWLVHLGINDGGGSATWQNNMQQIINALIKNHGAAPADIALAVPSARSNWQPYVGNLIIANGLTKGPDFSVAAIPTMDGIHPTAVGHALMAQLWADALLFVAPPPGPGNFADDFTRSDADKLGDAWSVPQGTYGIAMNEARPGTSPMWQVALPAGMSGNTQSAAASFAANYTNAGPAFGIVLRFQDSGNFYRVWRQTGSTSGLRIDKVVNGVQTLLKWIQWTNAGQNAFFRIEGRAEGNTIKLLLDGVERLSVTDTTFTGGGLGMAVWSGGRVQRVDSFVASTGP